MHRNGHFLWVITVEENAASGALFLEWLREIRHRGTFTSIVQSFESFLNVLRRLQVGKDMQMAWLKVRIDRHAIADK